MWAWGNDESECIYISLFYYTYTMKRVLLKLSGEMLQTWPEGVYTAEAIDKVAKTLVELQASWLEIVVVLWWWNIWRSRDTASLGIDRVVSDYLWMTGTIMNAVVVAETIRNLWWNAIVYWPASTQIPNATHVYSAIEARSSVHAWNIVFCSWWIFLPYATTDSTAVQRALELQCDTVIKATKVDGVYTKDPNKYEDAERYDELTYNEALEKQLDIMDHHALALARKQEMVLYICHMDMLDLLGTNAMKWTHIHV